MANHYQTVFASIIAAFFSMVCMMSKAMAAMPSEDQVKSLLAACPTSHRVLWPDGGEAELRKVIAADPEIQYVWDITRQSADQMLTEPPAKREMIGRRLLFTSRAVLKRTLHLGMAYRLTGDRRYADRAIAEMLAAAGFEDWNPSHFLDVAEMTAALGVGLDWCRDAMTPEQINTIKTAIVEKGLKPSFDKPQGWVKGTSNWNQVCNDGLMLGALAVSDTEPDWAAKTIVRAVEGLPFALKQYAPDGAYPEGPGYWTYGTTYSAMGFTALTAALGTDFDLSKQPGFLQSAKYYLHLSGPTGQYFNYSDCGQRTHPTPTPAVYFFALANHDDTLLFNERQWIRDRQKDVQTGARINDDGFLPLLLIWAQPSTDVVPKELHYVAGGPTPVATYRSGWDRDATYVAMKAGSASASHAHMDAGAFVIDALGERWADDMGMQEYESLESKKVDLWNMKQDSQRWQVFRIGPFCNNVLTVNDQLHDVVGRSTIVKSDADETVIDLSPVYERQLRSARRSISLKNDGRVVLKDEVTAADSPALVRFAFITRADVQLNTGGATLTRHGKIMHLTVSGVKDLKMETWSTVGPQPYDAPNPGTTLLGFKVPLASAQSAAWEVRFNPKTP